MKKMKMIVAFVAMAGVLFTSCETETGDAPTITFDNVTDNTVTLDKGVTEYTINGSILSDEGLATVKLMKVTDSEETMIGSPITDFDDKNDYRLSAKITGITADMNVKVTAIDKEAQETSKTLTIKITSEPLHEYSAKIVGSHDNADYGSFLNANTGDVFTVADSKNNKADIDMLYYYGSNNATLAAPNETEAQTIDAGTFQLNTWDEAEKNATLFSAAAITDLTWAEITTDVHLATAIAGADITKKKAKSLAKDQIYAFTTAAGKSGLVKVDAIEGEAAGYITVSVKIEK